MNKRLLRIALMLCTLFIGFRMVRAYQERSGRVSLPSSKLLLQSVPGNPQRTNSFPAAMALSPDGKFAALLNDGYGTFESQYEQSIAILDLASNTLSDFPDTRFQRRARQTYFYGLTFNGDGSKLFASVGSITDPTGTESGDTGDGIAVYDFENGKVRPADFIAFPPSTRLAQPKRPPEDPSAEPEPVQKTTVRFPAGLSVFKREGREMLLVADNLSDAAEIVDPSSKTVTQTIDLAVYPVVPGSYPLATCVTKDGNTGYVSLWNASRVAELDLAAGKLRRMIELHAPKSNVAPSSHPTALLLSPDESKLYVALANTDEVAVITRPSGEPFYLSTKLPGQQYGGSFPIALAQTTDGQHLFVANASSDAIAVFYRIAPNVTAQGFVPTEWYPTAVGVSNGELLIATGKGQGTGPNPGFKGSSTAPGQNYYIASLVYGSIARIGLEDIDRNLTAWTEQVMASNLMRGNSDQISFSSGKNEIKHVIYVIKENRTYDQILGDLGVGNGDPSITMYGEQITPNEHKLARQFGVLDNFYDSGEVSGDGHQWSNAAISSDYNEQTWEIAYRGKERSYDFGGIVDDRYPVREHIPDADDPGTGFLWGDLQKNGLTYRDYGEFISTEFCDQNITNEMPQMGTPLMAGPKCGRNAVAQGEPLPDYLGQPHGAKSPWPWRIPLIGRSVATKPELEGHFDPRYPTFNLTFPDQLRADEFLNEFSQFVARSKAGADALPQFILLYLPDDHTSGTKPGVATPSAAVADNDLALGRVVEAVSHSPFWNNTAIFVLEDDAQNGADHVDAHRSTALVISRFSPRQPEGKPFVDHTFYTTVNTVRTMEALLGLPPMNNNDAHAAVMASLFSGAGNQAAFAADTRNRDHGLIYKVNPPKGPDAKQSYRLDFSHPDAADAGILNAILWRDRFGNRPLPKAPGAEFR